jgi:hypothetical protein
MSFALILSLGLVLGLAYNVQTLAVLSIVVGLACSLGAANFGIVQAIATAAAHVATLQLGYLCGALAAARLFGLDSRRLSGRRVSGPTR